MTSEWAEHREFVRQARQRGSAPAPKPKRLTVARVRELAAGHGLRLTVRPYAYFDGEFRYHLWNEDDAVVWRGDRLAGAMAFLHQWQSG